jgi:hypothetical protein
MEKASGGSFARTTRKTAEDEGRRREDWDMTLNTIQTLGYAFLAPWATEEP